MKILGISAFYHDSAATIINNGEIVVAIEEERFSRIKHDSNFPTMAIQNCFNLSGLTINDIDAIAYYEKPILKIERLMDSFTESYPFSLKPFRLGFIDWFRKVNVEQLIRKATGWKKNIYYIPHHLSHAASAYLTSPYSHAAILTIDGVGEYQTTELWGGKNKDIIPLKSLSFPHSLGTFYSTFTVFLGFKINEDEYKVMGLAAYGKPIMVEEIMRLIDLKPDGSFQLDMSYFKFGDDFFQMWSSKFEKVFGKPRKSYERITQYHRNLAASIQLVMERIYFSILRTLYKETKEKNLCIGGGVALNALANGKIYKETPFKNIHIFGASGDSGAAIGAALYTYHTLLNKKDRSQPVGLLSFGTSYSDEEIETILRLYKVGYKKYKDEDEFLTLIAKLINAGKVVGWFEGKMEYGPRALGNRSILAKPNPGLMKDRMNVIKRREQFRPFAGSILQKHVHDYFEVPEKEYYSPFMNFCFQVKKSKYELLAAIVHKDGSCRIQTVNEDNGRYFKLIQIFYLLSGIPCILNTSFNLKGEPIVENPKQAIEDFLKTKMDYLAIGNFLVEK